MFLCEILNRTGYFGDAVFQERFFYEPFFLRNFQIERNSSSIRIDDEVSWLHGVDAVRSRKFRRTQHSLLHGDENEIDDVMRSPLFAEYRAALYSAYRVKGLPEYLKIHRRHHFAFMGDEILRDSDLRQHFVAKDYIVLDRADRIAQAVSLYIAYAKTQFIVTDESRVAWTGGVIPYDEAYLLKVYDMIALSMRRDWSPFIQQARAAFDIRVAYIDYDELTNDPIASVENALEEQLGYGISKERLIAATEFVTLRPAARPESRSFGDRLREALERREKG